ncbi:MAG: deoxyguanosinetriphosphate triphosphohydrolase [Ruminococcaceae bacterium]|nr:deoxyguanosinetriphosphate triphosphohydrolase [Oscillospiraceae bacterium]
MNIRQMRENQERETLSEYATLSENSKGRQNFEEKCPLRTDFSRDRDRIIHSKAFRRLKHKTQVFISLDNDHFRTRLTHTLEVSQIARTIARALGLNEDLAEAISMGHDLGHTPFGHSGERALDALSSKGFRHYEQSLRVVDILEKNGMGMNLTYEVRDGIVNHTGSDMAQTLEGRIVKYADRIAYINHDIDDAIRAGVIDSEDIPSEFLEKLGETGSQRIDNLISDIVYTSLGKNDIKMSAETEKNMLSLRSFMFENVYHNMALRDSQSFMVIEKLFNYFLNDVTLLPVEYKFLLESWDKETVVCDYIAGMTDNFCVALFNELFMPIK